MALAVIGHVQLRDNLGSSTARVHCLFTGGAGLGPGGSAIVSVPPGEDVNVALTGWEIVEAGTHTIHMECQSLDGVHLTVGTGANNVLVIATGLPTPPPPPVRHKRTRANRT